MDHFVKMIYLVISVEDVGHLLGHCCYTLCSFNRWSSEEKNTFTLGFT